jgi:hypothetical protein
MHNWLRGMGSALFLLAATGSASAMDQSAMEETNCLMACDANQQNCHAPGSASSRQNQSRAETSSLGVRARPQKCPRPIRQRSLIRKRPSVSLPGEQQ